MGEIASYVALAMGIATFGIFIGAGIYDFVKLLRS